MKNLNNLTMAELYKLSMEQFGMTTAEEVEGTFDCRISAIETGVAKTGSVYYKVKFTTMAGTTKTMAVFNPLVFLAQLQYVYGHQVKVDDIQSACGFNCKLYITKGAIGKLVYEIVPTLPAGVYNCRFEGIVEDMNRGIQMATFSYEGVTYYHTVEMELAVSFNSQNKPVITRGKTYERFLKFLNRALGIVEGSGFNKTIMPEDIVAKIGCDLLVQRTKDAIRNSIYTNFILPQDLETEASAEAAVTAEEEEVEM